VTAASTAPLNILDPFLYAGNPYPAYQWLRDEAPVYWDPVNQIWGVSRHADVLSIEVRRHEERVRAIASELIAAMAAKEAAEIIDELAAPLPAMVIGELLGFDRALWPKCREWSERTMSAAGYRNDDPRQPAGSPEAIAEFAAAFHQLIEARRNDPRDDLVSAWAHGAVDGQPLDVPEIIQEGLLLLDGGAETTRSVIGQTVWNLILFPDQFQILVADPSVIGATAVEEFIRYASPILNMRRTVIADHELHGRALRQGDQVLLMYAAANRDERAFDKPDRFDVTRRHNHHVAFGLGTHFCLGANLARLELGIVFDELVRRAPDIRLAAGFKPEFVPGYFTRTLKELPVEFGPEGGRPTRASVSPR
jgi:cytochrome P450 family 142 subfamily A polypeptide 1